MRELVLLFVRLGFTAFGGPAAHIGMMEDEVVGRRKWMTRQRFLDLVGATNLIPGPNSTEMALHVGYDRAGWRGMLAAGAAFILPAALTTGVLGALYVAWGSLPGAEPYLVGIEAAVLAIILTAVWRLGKKSVKSWRLLLIGAAAASSVLYGWNPIAVLFGGGLLGALWLRATAPPTPLLAAVVPPFSCAFLTSPAAASVMPSVVPPFSSVVPPPSSVLAAVPPFSSLAAVPPLLSSWLSGLLRAGSTASVTLLSSPVLSTPTVIAAAAGPAAGPVALTTLGLLFLKIGAVLYGSGYVLIAFLQKSVVEQHGWLTESQLLDVVALGQLTPGPVLATATVIGYMTAGFTGAVVATVAIFLPSFVFVSILNPLIPRLRESPWLSSFLDAVNVAAVGLMAAVLIELGRGAFADWLPRVIFALALIAILRLRLATPWVVLGAALLGAAGRYLGS